MKRRLMMLAVSALLMMGLSVFGSAQEQQAPPAGAGQGQGGGQGRGRGMMTPEDRVNRLSELNLTDDQKAKIKKIYEDQGDMAKMRDMSPEDRRAAMQATNDKVKAVLTDEQKKKFDDMQSRMRQGGGGRGPGGQGGEAPKPPSL